MKSNEHTSTSELSYYGLSLLSFLLDSHPHRADDRKFIEQRADLAAQIYSDTIRSGHTHIEAEEAATAELCRGLHFSPYNTLVNIVWDEFSEIIPEDLARSVVLEVLPLCGSVLAKYNLTDDFADTPQYDLLYTELVGIIQTLLDNGLQ